MVQIGSTPHAQDQVSVLVSRALQRGKLKSGNGTNGCLTPEILVVPFLLMAHSRQASPFSEWRSCGIGSLCLPL